MKKLTLLLWFAIAPAFGDISQDVWWKAHKQNNSVAQYIVAEAYHPNLGKEDGWYCEEGNFYLDLRDKRGECKPKSAEKYIEWLTKSANNGYPIAQTTLGIEFMQGKLTSKDMTKAIYWLEKAAGPVPKNVSFSVGEGTLWLADSIELGIGEAQYNLAIIYEEGLSGKPDYNKAVSYYQKACQSKDLGYTGLAQYKLANLYKDKIKDPQKALFWLEQTAIKAGSTGIDNKDINTILNVPLKVVNYYLSGGQIDGTLTDNIDYLRAADRLLHLVDRSSLPVTDRVEANFLLAWLYLTGKGVEQEPATAASYYVKGLELLYKQGKHSTFNLIGDPLQNELLNTVITPAFIGKMDITQASQVITQIFEHSSTQEQQFLTEFIRLIDGMDINSDQANVLKLQLVLLAKQHNFAIGHYMFAKLGMRLYRDASPYKDENFASDMEQSYFTALSLDPDNPNILYDIAVLNEFLLQDVNKALPYYQKASELSHKEATYRLGVLYYLGKGVDQDYKKTWQLLNTSAKLGFQAASNFTISITTSHPDAEWLKEQYLAADQSYRSPAVVVDGVDWLTLEMERIASPALNYHYFKRQSTSDKFDSYSYCQAAKIYAYNGDQATQKRFLDLVKRGEYDCRPSDEQFNAWLANTDDAELDKLYLTALFYNITNREQQKNVLMQKLIKQDYAKAYVYVADRLNPNKKQNQSVIKTYFGKALKQGNVDAAQLLMDYYSESYWDDKKTTNDPYQYQKFTLVRNDLAGYYQVARPHDYKQKEYSKYVYHPQLSKAEIFKIWREVAQMHELGNELPKNLALAYVWYSLLNDNNQPDVQDKIESIKTQLTVDQLQQADEILACYRDAYRFYLIS